MLNFDDYPGPEGTPLLIAHGLYGSARNWRAIARAMSKTQRVVAVDMRNHGASPRSDQMAYTDMAEDLAEVIAEIGGTAFVLGHSMGGKAAMVLALHHADRVAGMIVGDIAPVAYGHGAENVRFAEAMLSVDLTSVKTRSDADAMLASWVEDKGLRGFFLQSLLLEDETARWALNLEAIKAALPAIHGFPEVEGTYAGPVLALRGDTSDYVVGEGRARLSALFPKARHMALKDAGHWLHADQTRAFIATVEAWLGMVNGRPS